MTAVSLSITNGAGNLNTIDFNNVTVGTSAPGTGDFEFRWNLLDANNNTINRVELRKALKAFERVLANHGLFTTGSAG
jgi:hypothetical protein